MTKQQQTQLIDAADYADISAESYDSYSGRGMFGETTDAVTFECRADMDDAIQQMAIIVGKPQKFKSDNLGKGYVVY